jgi:hypothetical protein
MDRRWDIESIGVWLGILLVTVIFGGMKGFLYPIPSSRSVVFHYTIDPWNHPRHWEKETLITHIQPFFVICWNSSTRILERCSPLYVSMTLQVIEGLWYDLSRNPTRTVSSIKGSTRTEITHKLFVYDVATSFNRWPVSRAATVIASYWAPCLYILVVIMIHTPVMDHYWSQHPTSLISSQWSMPRHPAS